MDSSIDFPGNRTGIPTGIPSKIQARIYSGIPYGIRQAISAKISSGIVQDSYSDIIHRFPMEFLPGMFLVFPSNHAEIAPGVSVQNLILILAGILPATAQQLVLSLLL